MPRHRSLPALGHLCGRALVKGSVITVAGLLLVVGGAGVTQVQQAGEPRSATWRPAPESSPSIARLMERFDCSSLGYGDEETPQSALVRDPGGRVRVVTFDEGWSVYTARDERELVAVCLHPVPWVRSQPERSA